MMEEKLKQRLIGATVLVGLGVIFIPMLLNDSDVSKPKVEVPGRPTGGFTSQVVSPDSRPIDIQENKREGLLEHSPEVRVGLKSESVLPVEPIEKQMAEGVSPPQDGRQQEGQGGRETKTSVSEHGGTAGWAIQLASFSSEEKAAALKTRLQKRGYNAIVERTSGNRGKIFRVRVGPVSQAKAKELQAKLVKDVKLKGIVVRYP